MSRGADSVMKQEASLKTYILVDENDGDVIASTERSKRFLYLRYACVCNTTTQTEFTQKTANEIGEHSQTFLGGFCTFFYFFYFYYYYFLFYFLFYILLIIISSDFREGNTNLLYTGLMTT